MSLKSTFTKLYWVRKSWFWSWRVCWTLVRTFRLKSRWYIEVKRNNRRFKVIRFLSSKDSCTVDVSNVKTWSWEWVSYKSITVCCQTLVVEWRKWLGIKLTIRRFIMKAKIKGIIISKFWSSLISLNPP